jgi:site-specific DNA recombinase
MSNSTVTISSADPAPIIAAIYARTSSPNQRFNHSIEEQVEQCWKYCEERNWLVRYVFVDECESAKTVERPKFKLMLKLAQAGAFRILVFWKLDRFCRSLVDLVNVERLLRESGVGLCSVTEPLDTTSSVGRFSYRNLASFAELEREIIGERARLGLYALAREHKWPNPHAPLGYDKKENERLAINEREAQLVQSIFMMYLQKKSMPQVAYDLNCEGIRTKKGGKWGARTIREILCNKIYVGKYSVAGLEADINELCIVGLETFQKAQECMLRYRIAGAERPPISEERRNSEFESIHSRYVQFLREMKLEAVTREEEVYNEQLHP